MKKIIAVIISAAMAFSAFCITASAEGKTTPSGIPYENIGSEIDAFIEKYEAGLASCEVAVFDADGIIYNGYYGFTDIGNNVKADENAAYEWGSVSKILVWVSVMQQYERGNLDFETDIREYLPDGFLTKLRYKDEKMTMLDLMNHKAGFQESFYELQECREDQLFGSLEEAVRYCECYQAYHVGEYTSYSNWGTSLAAYIVECVSGEDYISYVHKNIFEPLGMEHTSLDPHRNDNEYVKSKRNELKIYYRGADRADDKDYGVSNTWVQLFPAGSAVGTLDDLAKFGRAFVTEDCPLFEKKETRGLMLSPTSFYGNSDIAKNCHGLWTSEYKVQTVGHAGNSYCSSMLQFYPVTGLGVIVMTNEPDETMFNYGIPELLFGQLTERDGYKDHHNGAQADISGFFRSVRGISSGSCQANIGGLPLAKNENGNYSLCMFGIPLAPDSEIVPVSDNAYIWENNGMKMFLYRSSDSKGRPVIEMMSQDYIKRTRYGTETAVIILLVIFAAALILTLIIKFILLIAKKRKGDAFITAQQIMYIITAAIVMINLGFLVRTVNYGITAALGIASALIGLLSLANGGFMCYNTVKSGDIKRAAAAKRIIWSILAFALAAVVVFFRMYQFWTL